jgi:ATP phosphoribosyltransferase
LRVQLESEPGLVGEVDLAVVGEDLVQEEVAKGGRDGFAIG